MKFLFLTLLACTLPFSTLAADKGRETGYPTPRFVSLKASEANLRKGPGTRYPIEWVFRRKHMPVEVLEEFGHWRRVRDAEGTSGWLHKQMIGGARYAMITEKGVVELLSDPETDAKPTVKLENGVIAAIEECEEKWCLLKIGKHEGWLEKTKFYGAYVKELYNP